MKKKDNRFITPTQLLRSAGCLHSYYLDLFGDPSRRRKESDAERFVREQGLNLQKEMLGRLSGIKQVETFASPEEGFQATSRWMAEGASWISQGALVRDRFAGIPDLLRKVPGSSRLGNYSYQPVEIKSHQAVTFYDRLQLFFYGFLLEPVLGHRPETAAVLTPDGSFREIRLTVKIQKQFEDLVRQTEEIRTGALQTDPLRCGSCSRCLWLPYCADQWEKKDHLSLISGLSATMAKKLAAHGISSCSRMAEQSPEEVSGILGIPQKLCRRFIEAAKARAENRPIVLTTPLFPEGRPVYFYDIETCDDTVFCHGIIRIGEDGSRKELCFFADHAGEEERNWHALLDFLACDEDPIVYCWTYYERYFVESLWHKFGGNGRGYRNLSRRLTDQCAFVRDHFALPCRGYSVKAVAPCFGFRWSSEAANGMNCVVWYRNWLARRDEALKEKIMQYNLDDVRAMAVIDEKLRAFVKNGKI